MIPTFEITFNVSSWDIISISSIYLLMKKILNLIEINNYFYFRLFLSANDYKILFIIIQIDIHKAINSLE